MSTKYVSNAATNGYVVGNDSNNGSTKALAYLTLDAALAGAVANDVFVLNAGTYTAATYYNITVSVTINAESGCVVTLKRTGAVTRVINVFSTAPVTLGAIVLDAEGTASCSNLTISAMATAPLITLNGTSLVNAGSGAQSVLLPGKIKLECKGVSISHSSNAGGVIAYGITSGYVNIDGLTIDNSSGSGSAIAAVNIDAGGTGVKARIKGVNGTWKSSGTNNAVIRTSGMTALIENNTGLQITGSDGGAALIKCLNTAYQADSCVIRYNQGVNYCTGGYLVLVGSDAASANDNKTNYPAIYKNDFAGTDAATLIHGIILGNMKGGAVFGNRIRKAGIPLISKLQTEAAYFVDNDIDQPVSGSSGCIRVKGSVNTQISGNRIRMSASYLNAFVSITKDPTVPTYSAGVSAMANTFYSSAAVTAAAGVGDATDTSTATLIFNNYVAPSFGGSAFVDHALTYGTVTAWQAVESTAMGAADVTTTDSAFWSASYRPMVQSALSATYPHLLPIF